MKKHAKRTTYFCLLGVLSLLIAGVTYAYLKTVFVTQKTATLKAPAISSVNGGSLSATVTGGSTTTDTVNQLPVLTCNSYTSVDDCSGATNYQWTTITANNGAIDDLKISIIKDSDELDGALVYLIKAFPNYNAGTLNNGVFMRIENSDLTWHTNENGKLQSNTIDLGFDIPSEESVDVTLNYFLDLTKMEQLAANNNLPDSTQNVQIFIEYSGDTHAME